MRKRLLFLVLLIQNSIVNSQTDIQLGFLPKVNTSIKLSESVKWVNSIEAREIFYDNQWQFEHSLIDIASILSLKTAIDQSLNIGYIVRFRDGRVVHRTLQYYNFIGFYDGYRIGHRLGFEQEFSSNQAIRFRTRYRFTYEKPLNGSKVDINEFYLKLGGETLYNFTIKDLEFRALTYLGYQVSKDNKIEIGFDSRLNGFLDNTTASKNWLRVTWYTIF